MEKASQLLVELVKSMVMEPDQVSVSGKADEMGVLLTLSVSKEDMGLTIGREGANAKALRTIMKAVGRAQGARVSLKIAEPESSSKESINEDDNFQY